MPSHAPAQGISAASAGLTLHALLDEMAARIPDQIAFRELTDSGDPGGTLAYGGLSRRARSIAAGLTSAGAVGKPVLLVHPPGLGFIEGLFACWHAGAIAVPAYSPRGGRHRQRLQAILSDSGAGLALTAAGMPAIQGIINLDTKSLLETGDSLEGAAAEFPGPCLLQYTSGSTAAPKGVMITHGNFRSHFSSLSIYQDMRLRSALSWLPPYHDMGLVLKILYAFEAGIPLTLFTPDQFIQRPVRWLQAISRYRAELSGAPNFAFEACLRTVRDEDLADLDLSCWKAAPCGAERIRKETLEKFAERFAPCGFSPAAFLPGYGLAETTLIVTACPSTAFPRVSRNLVSSGPPLPGVELRIADPDSGRSLPDGTTGEIRIRGPVVSNGYWRNPDATLESFGTDGELRTGDLGYLEDGHLYISGRIKDLIIIDGVNHSPEDIEGAVMSSLPEVTAAAAFATESDGRESIAVALEAAGFDQNQNAALCRKARRTVADALEMPLQRVVIVRSGLLPRTTSGKIRRSACRDALADGSLKTLHDDTTPGVPITPVGGHLAMLLAAVREVTGNEHIRPEDDIISLGMGSLDATRLAALVRERGGVDVSIAECFAAGSFATLADLISSMPAAAPPLQQIIPGCGRDSNVLTHAQERMWFLHQFDPESAAYHVFGTIELQGSLHTGKLGEAFQCVVSRHDILRSRHGFDHGSPRVWIEHKKVPSLEIHNITDDAALGTLLTDFARAPFQLAEESPIRAALISCGNDRHILAVCAHHIVADGWSMRLLAAELADHYSGKPVVSRKSAPSYTDYARHHRQWVDSGAIDEQVDYWKSRLAGHPGVIHLPTDFPRPHKPSSDGELVVRVLPGELCAQIAGLAKSHRATPFMVHLAAFLLLLRQHGAGNDPVVAIPVANRNHAAAADLIGTLVNTLPFRMPLDSGASFTALLDKVRDASFGMQANQDAPFEKIIDAVKPDRSGDHAPLAQVMFDHQEIPIEGFWPGGLACKPFIAHRGAAQFDLSLLLTVFSDHQQLAIEYRRDLFLPATINAMLDRHLATLELICRDPAISVTTATGLTESDRQWLARAANGPARPDFAGLTTPELIASRAALHPERAAASAAGATLTYQNLAERSDRLASALRARGVGPGERCAVLLERDADLPAILLAVWKTGAAYVPLDRANPPERLRLVLSDQAPLHVLVSPALADHLPPDIHPIPLDDTMMAGSAIVDLPRVTPVDAAYVIHTSGSTGRPKGVVVSHGALANFLLSMAETPGFTEADRLLAVTTISFDISLLELFLPLVTGGSVEIATTATARDGHALLERLHASSATVMQATPATWRLLLDAGWQGSPDLKILCGGEALDPALASTLVRKGCQLWNLYGPTETTVWSTCWRVPENPDRIRIGGPIANTGVHVLSEDGALLPPGVPGGLWISGAGLADGYWNRPDQTSGRFVVIRTPEGRDVRAYQTGDIARWHADGTLECLGRSDNQVKIRGFRVELGEIESVLASHPQVEQARVAMRSSNSPDAKLVGWITVNPGTKPPQLDALREFLAERLPVYMLPADIGVIASFPLGSSGKVDVTQLADPESTDHPDGPLTATEERLMDLWRRLLGRTSIHAEDNWFHIGGHSLLALRMFAGIHQDFKRRLPLSAILDHSTPRTLAAIIDATPPEETGTAP